MSSLTETQQIKGEQPGVQTLDLHPNLREEPYILVSISKELLLPRIPMQRTYALPSLYPPICGKGMLLIGTGLKV